MKWIFGNNTISLSIFACHKTKQRYNVVATPLSEVALKLPNSCSGNVRRRCKNDGVATSHYDVTLWDVATTSLTSSDVSIRTIWRRQGHDVKRRHSNVVTTSRCLLGFTVIFKSSPPEVFLRKGTLKICSILTGEHLCQSMISI